MQSIFKNNIYIYIYYDMHMHLSFKSVLVNECDQQTRYKDRQERQLKQTEIKINRYSERQRYTDR